MHATDPADLRRSGTALGAALAREGTPVAGGLSEAVAGLDRAPTAARQARFALALLRDGALPGFPASLLDWSNPDDLGPYALLYPLWGTPEADRFVEAVLGELPAYDARYGGELLPTLAAYLEHSGAASAAADRLAIHRNTLTYRLRRIAELTGRSPLDPAQQLSLRLAVMLHRLPPAEDA